MQKTREESGGLHERRTIRPGRAAAVCAAILLCLWSGYHLWQILSEDIHSRSVLHSLQAYVSSPDETASAGGGGSRADGTSQSGSSSATGAPGAKSGIAVDFAGLEAACPDVKAWIHIPGTNISHPVLQAADNSWYLTHGPDGRENRAGSIFLDSRCLPDFGSVNSVIYGHRMNNGTMFAGLHAFKDVSFREAHPYIYLSTPEGEQRCRIFEVSETDSALSSPAFQTVFDGAASVRAWLSEPAGELVYMFADPGHPATVRVLTLSTCVRGDAGRRLIVRAVWEPGL
ncbi:MAG: class B sortase [Clostridia bacterium]|nr:class B sortase [Clostridia bacterium]